MKFSEILSKFISEDRDYIMNDVNNQMTLFPATQHSRSKKNF